MSRTVSSAIALSLSMLLLSGTAAPCFAAPEPELNFKIYNPEGSSTAASDSNDFFTDPAAKKTEGETPSHFSVPITPTLESETPQLDDAKVVKKEEVTKVNVPSAAGMESATEPGGPAAGNTTGSAGPNTQATGNAKPNSDKVLKGYVRVVPTGTKIPIVMDTAVDSDTSQEGDEFSARTSEDLNIDGATVVPAGSIIKGRIAQINAPRHANRSGSVGLKFDNVTTPDGRQIPLVANLVARGGVVHARRGMKDIAVDTGTVTLPTVAGLAIGYLAGGAKSSTTSSTSSNTKIGKAGGAMIGVAVGMAVGAAILIAKKGKKVEVKPGDELKIELAEDLRMPAI